MYTCINVPVYSYIYLSIYLSIYYIYETGFLRRDASADTPDASPPPSGVGLIDENAPPDPDPPPVDLLECAAHCFRMMSRAARAEPLFWN